MSTESKRKGSCARCGHFMNGHAAERDAKCRRCGKVFEICQVQSHGQFPQTTGGWRICFRPCYCGVEYYPDKAKAARPLASHEYHPGHPGFQPLQTDDGDTTADYTSQDDTTTYDTTAYNVTSYDTATYNTMPLAPGAASYASATHGNVGLPERSIDGGLYYAGVHDDNNDETYTAAPSATASYATEGPGYVQAGCATTAYATSASGHAVYYSASAQAHAGHARPPSEGSEDPLAISEADNTGTPGAPVRQNRAGHVRSGSQGSDDPLTMSEPQPYDAASLADMFSQVSIGEDGSGDYGAFGPVEVATEVRKGAIVFEYPPGHKFKTKPEEWQEMWLEESSESYLLFTHQSGQQYWARTFGPGTNEVQASGSKSSASKSSTSKSSAGKSSGEKGSKSSKEKARSSSKENPRKK